MEFSDIDKERLSLFKELGFDPKHIYDVGGSNGSWTQAIATIFPNAHYYLFEPLANVNPDYRKGLDRLMESDINSQLYPLALGSQAGRASMGVSKNFVGSSVLATVKNDIFPTSEEVDIVTLDSLIKEKSLPYPDFIKMDTQGYELEILKGATETLEHVQMILIESWVVRSYLGKTPLMIEMMLWLAEKNFFLLDFGGEYRDKSGILYSQDLFFIKQPCPISSLSSKRAFDLRLFSELHLTTEDEQGSEEEDLEDQGLVEIKKPGSLNKSDGPKTSTTQVAATETRVVSSSPPSRTAKSTLLYQEIQSDYQQLSQKFRRLKKQLNGVKTRSKRQRQRQGAIQKKHGNSLRKLRTMNNRIHRLEAELNRLKSNQIGPTQSVWSRLKRKLGLL